MSELLPFALTPEATGYVRSHLQQPGPGEELALITVLRRSCVADGKERVWFEGEHFMICTYDVGQRPHADHVDLFGYRVSVLPSTLDALRGRTLSVRHVTERRGWFRKVIRDVLVAS